MRARGRQARPAPTQALAPTLALALTLARAVALTLALALSLAQGLVLAPALTLILSRLASGGGDGVVTLWREGAGGGFEASARCDAKCVVRGLAALPGGGFAQVGNDGVLKVWGAAGSLETKTEPVGGYPYPYPYPLPLPLPLP